MLRLAVLAILASLALSAGAANVNKCTRADGSVYYSGQPCPSDEKRATVRVPRSSSTEQADDQDAPAGKTLDERIAEADDPVLKAQLELRKKECDLARTQLGRYEDAPYLIEKKADGTERQLSEEETAAEKARLARMIKEQCR